MVLKFLSEKEATLLIGKEKKKIINYYHLYGKKIPNEYPKNVPTVSNLSEVKILEQKIIQRHRTQLQSF